MNNKFIKIIISLFFLGIIVFIPVKTLAQGGGGAECSCQCGCKESGYCLACPPVDPPGGEVLDCSNDGPTNQCSGIGKWECPAGFEYSCDASAPICPARGLSLNYINHYCGTTNLPNTKHLWNPDPVWACCQYGYTDCNCVYRASIDDYICQTCWGCEVPTNCFSCGCKEKCAASAPGQAGLVSPSNWAILTDTAVELKWSAPNWGISCTGSNKLYWLYTIEYTNGAWSNVSGPITVAANATGNTTYQFNGTVGHTYAWAIRSFQGQLGTLGPWWYFSIVSPAAPVVPTDPWWQVRDGDVTTNGSLLSNVPSGQLFNLNGLGGFPGVSIYGNTFNLSSSPDRISSTKWNANTQTFESRLFDYSYFDNLIPDDVIINDIANLRSGGDSSYGYEWFRTTTDFSIDSDIDFGSRKVILFVDGGSLNINAKVNLDDNVGFFANFVTGNININSSVGGGTTPVIEGLYLTNSDFSTGEGNNQLYIRGSVVAYGNVNLQRDLDDNTYPAEYFEYAPDQILLFPDKLGFRKQRWVEVAP